METRAKRLLLPAIILALANLLSALNRKVKDPAEDRWGIKHTRTLDYSNAQLPITFNFIDKTYSNILPLPIPSIEARCGKDVLKTSSSTSQLPHELPPLLLTTS